MRLFLIGPMGSGKTTVGNELAKTLNIPFIDSDMIICEKLDSSIEQVFKQHGEKFFRDLEANTIMSLTKHENIILATGGGCILRPKTCSYLRQGLICYLRTSVQVQLERLALDTNSNRPTLPPLAERQIFLESMAKTRENIYNQLADISICTDSLDIATIVAQIAKQMRV